MTPQELKSSILQLAIQGKLVEQRPEEGTGEELYQQIQAEKKRLIQEGKIKKEKPLPEIAEDEMPFEIPESWKWVQWGEIVNIVSARRVHQSDWKMEGIPFYRAREIAKLATDGYVENELFISQELYEEFSKSGVPKEGDLMVTAVGTLGKTYIVKDRDHFYYKDASVICFENYAHVCPEYLKYLMESELMKSQIRSNSGGTTVATLTMVRMVEYLMPLPPLAEQKRIVAQIEQLLPYLDRYEKAWNRLEDFGSRFPADMQKSILQMAIQGKLVEQRPEEGTGEELYRQIQAEKQALIKAGKIKKEKPLPEIAEDEVPFEIPEGWKWCRLLDLCSLIGDIDHNMPKSVDKNHGVLFLSAKDLLDDGSINYIDNVKYISNEDYDRLSRKVKPQLGDIVYSRIGACLGKARTVKSEVKFLVSYSCCIIRSIQIDVDYLRYYLESPIILAHSVKARQSIGVPDLGMGEIKKYFIALPPLAEQKRIVERLEEILPLCERLK
ncbi:MAG: restriction endonuclease subunit S [Firmicutes bacterium]|nr:restriction endonuclease subunit S [Bacillota bacterium]